MRIVRIPIYEQSKDGAQPPSQEAADVSRKGGPPGRGGGGGPGR